MSFIQTPENTGKGWEAGYFLVDDENCTRVTAPIKANHASVVTRADGSKYVPAGSVIPSNDSNAIGILYENVDVTTGDMPGSIVIAGIVYKDRLPVVVDSDAVTALAGITFDTYEPTIARPSSFGKTALGTITVTSAAHATTTGSTAISVSGYTPGAGEKYAYKVAQTTAPSVYLGEIVATSGTGSWTVAAMPVADLASTDGYKITVISIDQSGAAVASGNTTIDVK